MIARPFWLNRIEQVWKEVSIAWICGVRRSGKTILTESLGQERALYFNCVVFDEIHQLHDPTRLLKIGADVFPQLKILATGSSTLAASKKFRDTLTGRKRAIHLVPVLWDELSAFAAPLPRRLLHGGLPPALLADSKKPGFYREWLDSFFARDIQRLFGFRDMNRFNALFEYALRQSGGQFEGTKAAAALGITRPTVESHVRALEITNAATLVRPFHGSGRNELVKMPKIYAFDTGFVSFARGWDTLRSEDLGLLWEHLVLEHLQAHFPDTTVRYWRDKAGHEIDFVLAHGRDRVDTIACKWSPSAFDSSALETFRAYYPKGRNYLITPSGDPAYTRRQGGLEVRICTPTELSPAAGPALK